MHFDTQPTLGPPEECGITVQDGESPSVLGLSQRIMVQSTSNHAGTTPRGAVFSLTLIIFDQMGTPG